MSFRYFGKEYRIALFCLQSIPDKSVADAVEALIGVYLLTYGPAGATVFMEWLGLKVRPPNVRRMLLVLISAIFGKIWGLKLTRC